MKGIILAILAVQMLSSTPSTPTTETALYPTAGIVTEINSSTNTVTVTMANGNVFAFYGINDWCEGDIAALTMDDNGTEKVYDDTIVEARYVGTPEMLLENN